MLRELITRPLNKVGGKENYLNRKEVVYYPFLHDYFPKREYRFSEPEAIIIMDKRLRNLSKTKDHKDFVKSLRTVIPGKRFIQFIDNSEDLENFPKKILKDIPIITGDKQIYRDLQKHFPKILLIDTDLFALPGDLLREVIFYLPRVEFLSVSRDPEFKDLSFFSSSSFWREKIRSDFHVEIKDPLCCSEKQYLELFARYMTLPEAIEYGKTRPSLDIFEHKDAVAFGYLLIGKDRKIVKEFRNPDNLTSLLIAVKLQQATDKDLIKFFQSIVDTSDVSRDERNNIKTLFEEVKKQYFLWYFTPEIIRRSVELGDDPSQIRDSMGPNYKEYLSTNAFFDLMKLYPEIKPESFIRFFIGIRMSPENRKRFLDPLLAKTGLLLVKVAYELVDRERNPLNEELADYIAATIRQRDIFDNFVPASSEILHEDNKYYLLFEGFTSDNKNYEFKGDVDRYYDEDGIHLVDLLPMESQIITSGNKPRIFDIEKLRQHTIIEF